MVYFFQGYATRCDIHLGSDKECIAKRFKKNSVFVPNLFQAIITALQLVAQLNICYTGYRASRPETSLFPRIVHILKY